MKKIMTSEIISTIQVCIDCLHLHANGEFSEDRDDYEPEPLALITPGYSVTMGSVDNEDEDLGFSWRGCGGCGSSLAGDRFALTLWKEED